jgi:AcrR family transcriptional regulator
MVARCRARLRAAGAAAARKRTRKAKCPERARVTQRSGDTKVDRTRAALRQAFFQLVSTRPYEQVRIADISRRAGVGRSTFYEHFRSKDDLLLASLRHLLEVLAGCVAQQPAGAPLEAVLQHFWENRRLARPTLAGTPRPRVARLLAGLVEQRLPAGAAARPARRAVARHLAEGMLGLLVAWLTGELACDAATLASTLRRTGRASAEALQ